MSTTDADGVVEFDLDIGGCCEREMALWLYLDLPPEITVDVHDTIGSPDSNSDGQVDLADFVELQLAFLSESSCHDLAACDLQVDLADFVVFMRDFPHGCP